MKIILLYSGNVILEVLGVFKSSYQAKVFIEEDERFNEFHKDVNQYSKYDAPEFIRIETIK